MVKFSLFTFSKVDLVTLKCQFPDIKTWIRLKTTGCWLYVFGFEFALHSQLN